MNVEQIIEKLEAAVADLYEWDCSEERYQRIRPLLQAVDRDVSSAVKTLKQLLAEG